MSKRIFEVEFRGLVKVELDDLVIAVVDDEWRSYLYDLKTPKEIAEHIAFNLVLNNGRLSILDGWADQPDSNAKVTEEDWDIEAEEIKDEAEDHGGHA